MDLNGQAPTNDQADGADLNQLARQLSELARTLEAEDDTDRMLDDLAAAAVANIQGVDEGSISVVGQA